MEQNTIKTKKCKEFVAKSWKQKTKMTKFLQAVKEVAVTVIPFIADKKIYRE